jgi:hypothetical protein
MGKCNGNIECRTGYRIKGVGEVSYTLSLTSSLDWVDNQHHAPVDLTEKIKYQFYMRVGVLRCILVVCGKILT